MESKLVKGLYFIGEVLDLDAVTGGFNLQIAWSTAYAAEMRCDGLLLANYYCPHCGRYIIIMRIKK